MTERELAILTDCMDKIDINLYQAELAGDTKDQIHYLTERAKVWRKYAEFLKEAGRDHSGAILAAQRDELRAAELAQ